MNFNLYKRRKKKYDIKFVDFKYKKSLKKLLSGNFKSLGRSKGQIVMWHRGGGVKKTYRQLWSLSNIKTATFGIIKSVNYNPSKSSFMSLIQFNDGSFSNIDSSSTTHVDQIVRIDKETLNSSAKEGDVLKLRNIPRGIPFYDLEKFPNSGPIYSRAAGSRSFLLSKESLMASIKLVSGDIKNFDLDCSAVLGVSSNRYNKFNKKYKAGTNRLLNRRPIVRGVAMNPVDHPHGGGEGKGRPGRPSVSPWGKLTKGVPTKKKKYIQKKYN